MNNSLKEVSLERIDPDIIKVIDNDKKEVFRVDPTGRIFWRGREVETDSDFRSSMMDLKDAIANMFTSEDK